METTHGILIRKIRLTESSLIVTWFGKESGKIKTVIRSALKTNSKFSGKADLFYEAEVFFTRSRKGDLCELQDIVVHHRFESCATDYTAMVMCSYFSELIEITTDLFHPMPAVYDLLHRALTHLDKNAPSQRALFHFEKELCVQLGISDPRTAAGTHHVALQEYSGKRSKLRNTLAGLLAQKI
ncbi:MAG: DNA repair protein RecO [Chthoniobacterales bacterium]